MPQTPKNPIFLDFAKLEFEELDFTIQFAEMWEKYGVVFKRIYFLNSGNKAGIRGNHAHLNQDQVFIKFYGNIGIKLVDSFGKETSLIIEDKPLFVPKNYWIELEFEPNSSLLCLATKAFSELETISDKSQFLNQK